MPGNTGSRTPTAPPRNDSGVCAISPSDLVGATGNLMNRVKDLEQEVAELKAAIVKVNQISDLGGQIGWIGGITYMGTDGWTQTEYGTLIPPPGFYIGNIIPGYNGGFYDANGILQLGFGTDGLIYGASAAAGGAIAMLYTDEIRAQTVGNFSSTPLHYEGYDPNGLVTLTNGGANFTVNTSGFYHLSLHCRVNGWGTQTTSGCEVLWNTPGNVNAYDADYGVGPCISRPVGDTGGFSGARNTPYSNARLMHLSSSSSMSITGSGAGTTTTFLVSAATLGLRLLKAT